MPAVFLQLVELATWSGCQNVRPDIVWIWIRPCSSATAGSRGRCAGPTRASMDGPPIIRWWRCWPKHTFCCHGCCAAATAARPAALCGLLKEALALLPEQHAIRVVRADAGFFDQQLLEFLEQRGLSYIVVARLTRWLKREAARVTQWRALDQHYAVGEFSFATVGAGSVRAASWGHPRTAARRAKPRWEENYSRFPAIPSASSSPTSLCRRKKSGEELQPQGGHGKSHRRTEIRSGRR